MVNQRIMQPFACLAYILFFALMNQIHATKELLKDISILITCYFYNNLIWL